MATTSVIVIDTASFCRYTGNILIACQQGKRAVLGCQEQCATTYHPFIVTDSSGSGGYEPCMSSRTLPPSCVPARSIALTSCAAPPGSASVPLPRPAPLTRSTPSP